MVVELHSVEEMVGYVDNGLLGVEMYATCTLHAKHTKAEGKNHACTIREVNNIQCRASSSSCHK